MLEELVLLMNEMQVGAEPQLKEGWKQIEPLISPSGIITLTWPKWKLKITSFKMPNTQEGKMNHIETLRTIDELYVSKVESDKPSLLWRTPQSETKYNWSEYEKPYVVDVVDWFLKGDWTPPWKCGHCMARHKTSSPPKF